MVSLLVLTRLRSFILCLNAVFGVLPAALALGKFHGHMTPLVWAPGVSTRHFCI